MESLEDLQRRFGVNGLVKFEEGRGGLTKIAVNSDSRLDCHDAGPKCAISGRSRQSREFTVLRVSVSWTFTTVSLEPNCATSCLGHSVAAI